MRQRNIKKRDRHLSISDPIVYIAITSENETDKDTTDFSATPEVTSCHLPAREKL